MHQFLVCFTSTCTSKLKRHFPEIFLQIAGLLFIAGVLIVSSDGPFFPWINAIGVLVSLIGAMMSIYYDRNLSRPAPRRD